MAAQERRGACVSAHVPRPRRSTTGDGGEARVCGHIVATLRMVAKMTCRDPDLEFHQQPLTVTTRKKLFAVRVQQQLFLFYSILFLL